MYYWCNACYRSAGLWLTRLSSRAHTVLAHTVSGCRGACIHFPNKPTLVRVRSSHSHATTVPLTPTPPDQSQPTSTPNAMWCGCARAVGVRCAPVQCNLAGRCARRKTVHNAVPNEPLAAWDSAQVGYLSMFAQVHLPLPNFICRCSGSSPTPAPTQGVEPLTFPCSRAEAAVPVVDWWGWCIVCASWC